MIRPGQLIVFEGADAAGKSSVSEGVTNELRRLGLRVELQSFPGRTPHTLGELVYRLHHDSRAFGIETLTPASLQTLHIAAHFDAIESRIMPTLKAGVSVILDRYWWSTWVYGVVDGISRDLLMTLIEAEKLAWGAAIPTMLFYLTRQTPLRDEPGTRWQQLNAAYGELIATESGRYPICVIKNEISLSAAISEVLAHLPVQ